MFTFDTLWTPRIMNVLYIIGLFVIVLGGLGAMYMAMGPAGGGAFGALWAIIGTGVALVLWRVWCEIALVLFKLHDRLVEVRDALVKR